MYGVEDPQELVGRKFSDFVAADRSARLAEAFDSAVQVGHTPEIDQWTDDAGRWKPDFHRGQAQHGHQEWSDCGYPGVVRDVTERKQTEEEIKTSNDELSMLFELSHALAEANTLQDILELVNRHAVESIHITFARIALMENEIFSTRAAYPIRFLVHGLGIGERNPAAALPTSRRVLEQNEPVVLRADDQGIRDEEKKILLLDFAQSVCLIPLRISDSSSTAVQLMGLLMLGEVRSESREPFTSKKLRLAQTIGDSATIAIRRMLLREKTERHMQQLTALSTIDRAISSTFDLQLSLGVLLQQVSSN